MLRKKIGDVEHARAVVSNSNFLQERAARQGVTLARRERRLNVDGRTKIHEKMFVGQPAAAAAAAAALTGLSQRAGEAFGLSAAAAAATGTAVPSVTAA